MSRALDESIIPLDDYQGLLDLYREAKANGTLWKAREEELRLALLQIIGEASHGTVDGETVITHVVSKGRTSIDSEKLHRKWPEIWDRVVKQGNPSHSLRLADLAES